jgi:hypothetical protein
MFATFWMTCAVHAGVGREKRARFSLAYVRCLTFCYPSGTYALDTVFLQGVRSSHATSEPHREYGATNVSSC